MSGLNREGSAELDIEALKRARLGPGTAEDFELWARSQDAIIAALEDRERLRAAAVRMKRWGDQIYRLGVLAEQDLDFLLVALEGRDA